ncbi:recombinase family protein [Mesobacillus subterraneus]|uniref:recombinase family protein n=1 Tax=Mesobacillus subterraneus TaxID=285983 RepID=UPI00274015BE|nr:recombinase family protein [Mesobacillus subterraneus]WLR54321.1 recombinase family protein [Mesobacillus subterraneus]
MMSDLETGMFDVVLVYRLDRLTRSVLDLYKLLAQFDQFDVKFKSATEIYDTTTATGRLFITLVAALAQWERENLAERVKMGMLKKANLGEWLGGTTPFGYEQENGKFLIIDDEAKIVKMIFQMARTKGMDSIARQLNQMGYRTRKGSEWAGYTVQYIAKNPIYIGKFRFNDERHQLRKPLSEQQLFDTDIENIINEKEFWDLQAILEKRSENKGRGMTGGYYFTSLLRCGKCGSPMQGTVYKFKNPVRSVKYYRCSHKTKGRTCPMPNIQEDRLSDEFLRNFPKLVTGWIKTNSIKESSSEEANADFSKELKNVQRQMEKYKMMFINDLIDIEELNGKMHLLRDREKALKESMNSESASSKESWSVDELESLIEKFPQIWAMSTDEERKVLLSEIFTEIIIDADEKAKVSPGNPKPFWIESAK